MEKLCAYYGYDAYKRLTNV